MDNHRYIYFQTLDYTGTPTTSGYTLAITPFTFRAIFDDGSSNKYSSVDILWDFGDGTRSRSLTATHQFKSSGWYNVKCYVLGENGVAHESSFSQLILVKDFIGTSLALSGQNNKNEAGKPQNPYVVYRFNSWQGYDSLSADGYTINLNALSTNAPYYYQGAYIKDKWAHLKPSSRFVVDVYNENTKQYESDIVNSLTTDNTELYVKINPTNNTIVFCKKNDYGSCFAGTSGKKLFYFIDDIPVEVNDVTKVNTATINVSFDTTKFKDRDNTYRNYPQSQYNILNSVKDTNAFSQVIEQLNPDSITITSNGIDDNNLNELIHTFDIFDQKFTGQKIPFVAKVRDKYNFPSKYNKTLKLKEDNSELSAGEIEIKLLSNGIPVDNSKYQIVSNFSVLSSENHGGYFKGYLIANTPISNASIYAETVPTIRERFLVESTVAFVTEPASKKMHKITFTYDATNPNKKLLSDELVDFQALTGIYSSCITSQRQIDGSVVRNLWLADADSDLIRKYNVKTPTLSAQMNLGLYFGKNVSPSNIVSNFDTDVWITLFDAMSTIRMSNLDNTIQEIITPKCVLDKTIDDTEYQYVQPAAVEVDRFDNLTISYSNINNSFIEKYLNVNNKQVFLSAIQAPSNYYFTEIISDSRGSIWGILKDGYTTSGVLSSKTDKIFTCDLSGRNFTTIPISGSLWNISLDCNSNIWATRNIHELVKLDTQTLISNIYKLPSSSLESPLNYISNYMGLACSTDNTMYVIDNYSKNIKYFNATTPFTGVETLNLIPLQTSDKSNIQDILNGYGDWNGFRHIYKFQHIFIEKPSVNGVGNVFSIFDPTHPKYQIRKVNENFDMALQLKSYIHQEYLADSKILIDNFISTAVGTASSDPNTLGKRIYEKISNFSSNNADVDTCRIEALKSMYMMLDEDLYTFNSDLNSMPANLKRLVDLFSVKFTKLRGSRNKENINFDKKGFDDMAFDAIYGKNLGSEISFETAIISAGIPVVVFEKFSEKFKLINTNIAGALSSYHFNTSNTYFLSSYSDQWGWGLVLPDNYRTNSIPHYYTFYTYNSSYNNEQTDGIINWQDSMNTIVENLTSVSQWESIKMDLINYTLTKGLSIIK